MGLSVLCLQHMHSICIIHLGFVDDKEDSISSSNAASPLRIIREQDRRLKRVKVHRVKGLLISDAEEKRKRGRARLCCGKVDESMSMRLCHWPWGLRHDNCTIVFCQISTL